MMSNCNFRYFSRRVVCHKYRLDELLLFLRPGAPLSGHRRRYGLRAVDFLMRPLFDKEACIWCGTEMPTGGMYISSSIHGMQGLTWLVWLQTPEEEHSACGRCSGSLQLVASFNDPSARWIIGFFDPKCQCRNDISRQGL